MEMEVIQNMDVRQYQAQGYLIVKNLISDQEINQLRQRTEDIIAGRIPEYPSSTIELEPGATRIEMKTLENNPSWMRLRAVANNQVFLTDGNQYFNRPGPRLSESLEILADIIHEEDFNFGHKGSGWEVF